MANGVSEVDSLHQFGSKRFKKPDHTSLMEHTRLSSEVRFKNPDHTSLMEHTRLRNIAISRRKLELNVVIVESSELSRS